MNDSKDMKVVFGAIIAIVVVAVFGVMISSTHKTTKSDFSLPTSTPEVIISNTSTSTATTTKVVGQPVKTVTPEALALVLKIEKSAGLTANITKQIFTFNYTGNNVQLNGYGFDHSATSSIANTHTWNKMIEFMEKTMNLNILNSASGDNKLRTYSGIKFICVLFERPITNDVKGPVSTGVRCAESKNVVR
jgi:hypothetical protein